MCKNHIHTSTLYPNIFQNNLEDIRITCREKNEAQATIWLPAPQPVEKVQRKLGFFVCKR